MLIVIIGAALLGIQTYMKRGIQGVVKLAADDIGEQKKGLMEYDYQNVWKIKGDAKVTSEVKPTSHSYKTITEKERGKVIYGTYEKSTQKGTTSSGAFVQP